MKWGRRKSESVCTALTNSSIDPGDPGPADCPAPCSSSSSSSSPPSSMGNSAGSQEMHCSDVTCTWGLTVPRVGDERVPWKRTTLPGFKRSPSDCNAGSVMRSTVSLRVQKYSTLGSTLHNKFFLKFFKLFQNFLIFLIFFNLKFFFWNFQTFF